MAETPPSFQFYPKEFLSAANCTRLTDEEAGIYIRMMSLYWNEGCSLPSDLSELAAILPRTPLVRLQKAWPRLSACFQQTDDGRLRQKRLDQERVKQVAYNERQSIRAALRWPDATGMPRHSPDNANVDSAGNALPSPVSRLPFPVSSSGTREAPSPAIQFGMWFVTEAVGAGTLGEHELLDRFTWAYKHLATAEVLLKTYGEHECRVRSLRLFAAKKANKVRRNVSLGALADCWDWDVVKPASEGSQLPKDARWGDV